MPPRKSSLPTLEQAAAARRMDLILSFHAPDILGSTDGLLLPPTVARFVAAHFKTWAHAAETERFSVIGPFYRPGEVVFTLIPHEFREQSGNVLLADPDHSIRGRFERLLSSFRITADLLRIEAMTPVHQRENGVQREEAREVRPEAGEKVPPESVVKDDPTTGGRQLGGVGSQLLLELVDTLNKGREAITFIPPPRCGPVELPPPGTVISRPKERVHPSFDLEGPIHGLLRNGDLVAIDKWLVRRARGGDSNVIGTQFSDRVRATGETLSFPLYEIVEEKADTDGHSPTVTGGDCSSSPAE
jgi:hypothetical protein